MRSLCPEGSGIQGRAWCYREVPGLCGGAEMIEIVFIGERFYKESQTLMSAIYKSLPGGLWERYDWGALQIDINAGKDIHIRSATEKEIRLFEIKLNETLVRWGYQPGMKAQIHDDTPDFWYAVMSLSNPFAVEEEPPFKMEQP
jgi:hypothetical protein